MYTHNIIPNSVSSPSQVLGEGGLGGAYNHIKTSGPAPFPHQRKISTEGIWSQCA